MPFFWLTAAFAADTIVPLVPEPDASAWDARLGLGAGVYATSEAAWPLGQLSHAVGAGGQAQSVHWQARSSGVLRYTLGGALEYLETAEAGIGVRNAGLVGRVELGGSPGYTQSAVLGRWTPRRGNLSLDARGGLVLASEETRAMSGAAAELSADYRLSPRARVGAWTAGRGWFSIHAPLVSAEGGAYGSWTPRLDLRLTLSAGGRGASYTADESAGWAGLPLPGHGEAWATARAAWSPWRAVALYVEAGGLVPVAGDGSTLGWATAGVEGRLGGLASKPPDRAPVMFRYEAPAAQSVAVAGSFNSWVPQPLERQGDGVWTLPVPILPGTHEYVYIVDGLAVVPPESPRQVDDGMGGVSGVVVVP